MQELTPTRDLDASAGLVGAFFATTLLGVILRKACECGEVFYLPSLPEKPEP
jgi:hypothetical protein